MELLIGVVVGFGLGYGVRSFLSRHRRERARRDEFQAAARCEIPRMACRWTVEIHGISDGDDIETDPVAIGLSGES
jgi:hypothetical protein